MVNFSFTSNNTGNVSHDVQGRTVRPNDIITVFVNSNHYSIDSIDLKMNKRGSSGFFGSKGWTENHRIDNVEGSGIVKFRYGDFFNRDGDELSVNAQISLRSFTEHPTDMNLAFKAENNAQRVSINKTFWQLIKPDEEITITAEQGYTIHSLSLTAKDITFATPASPTTIGTTQTISRASGRREFSFKWQDYLSKGSYIDLIVDIAEGEDVVKTTYLQNLVNVTGDFDGDEVEPTQSITYRADTGYVIDSAIITITDGERITKTTELEIDRESKSITLNLDDYISNFTESIEVYISATRPKSWLYLDLNQAHSNIPHESRINNTDSLVITAEEGYVFNEPITLLIQGGAVLDIPKKRFQPNEDPNFNEDNTEFTLNFSDIWLTEWYAHSPASIEIVAIAGEPLKTQSKITNFVNVYNVSTSELNQLSHERYFSSTELKEHDYGDYIHNIYSVPLKIDNDNISSLKSNIYLGSMKTKVTANTLLDNKILFDLGTIEIPEKYNNVYDYRDTEILIHVPHHEQPISIDPTYAIGHKIGLVYSLDLYNGKTKLAISSSKIDGGLVKREDIPLTHKIPFRKAGNYIIESEIGDILYNVVTQSYIEVVRNIPYDRDSEFGKEANDNKLIGDIKGYLEVSEVHLKTHATKKEISTIESLLSTGVRIL